jgi:hypothetical protein
MNADIKRKRIIYNNERRSSSQRNFSSFFSHGLQRLPPSAFPDGIDQCGINQWPKRRRRKKNILFFVLFFDQTRFHPSQLVISKTFFSFLFERSDWAAIENGTRRCCYSIDRRRLRGNLQVSGSPAKWFHPHWINQTTTATTNPSKRIRAWRFFVLHSKYCALYNVYDAYNETGKRPTYSQTTSIFHKYL